jgi:hypothetical protein
MWILLCERWWAAADVPACHFAFCSVDGSASAACDRLVEITFRLEIALHAVDDFGVLAAHTTGLAGLPCNIVAR